ASSVHGPSPPEAAALRGDAELLIIMQQWSSYWESDLRLAIAGECKQLGVERARELADLAANLKGIFEKLADLSPVVGDPADCVELFAGVSRVITGALTPALQAHFASAVEKPLAEAIAFYAAVDKMFADMKRKGMKLDDDSFELAKHVAAFENKEDCFNAIESVAVDAISKERVLLLRKLTSVGFNVSRAISLIGDDGAIPLGGEGLAMSAGRLVTSLEAYRTWTTHFTGSLGALATGELIAEMALRAKDHVGAAEEFVAFFTKGYTRQLKNLTEHAEDAAPADALLEDRRLLVDKGLQKALKAAVKKLSDTKMLAKVAEAIDQIKSMDDNGMQVKPSVKASLAQARRKAKLAVGVAWAVEAISGFAPKEPGDMAQHAELVRKKLAEKSFACHDDSSKAAKK
ncbi:unnamed protein product, partial [Prorocentrum cordatum]